METELNAVFGDFEVGDADNAVTKKKSPYPMSNEIKFNFLSFVVTFARGQLPQSHARGQFSPLSNVFYEFEQHLNETNVVFT